MVMVSYHCLYAEYVAMILIATFFVKERITMKKVFEALSYEENIIQLKLTNVPKHPKIIAKIFTIISNCGVNVDMISQVMVEDAMQIAVTLDEKYQKNLNDAIMCLKDEVKQLEISTSRQYFKIAVGGDLVEVTPGAYSEKYLLF